MIFFFHKNIILSYNLSLKILTLFSFKDNDKYIVYIPILKNNSFKCFQSCWNTFLHLTWKQACSLKKNETFTERVLNSSSSC